MCGVAAKAEAALSVGDMWQPGDTSSAQRLSMLMPGRWVGVVVN